MISHSLFEFQDHRPSTLPSVHVYAHTQRHVLWWQRRQRHSEALGVCHADARGLQCVCFVIVTRIAMRIASGLPRVCLGFASGLPRVCLGFASGLPRVLQGTGQCRGAGKTALGTAKGMHGYVLVCKRDRLPLSKRTATLGHVPRSGNEYCVAYTVYHTGFSYGLSTANAMRRC